MGSPPETVIEAPAADRALERFQTQPLDRYDPFVLEAASSAGVVAVLTDDGDFGSGPGLRAFSANRNLITAARALGKPVQRKPGGCVTCTFAPLSPICLLPDWNPDHWHTPPRLS